LRGDCKVQIGTNYWNFGDLFAKKEVYKTEFEGIDYFISFKNPLKKADVPDYGAYSLEVDTRAMACNQSAQECWEIAFSTDFEYKLENPQNPGVGLIYFADGQPHHVKDKLVYDLYDISHNIHCNEEKTGDVEPLIIPTIRNGEHVQFYFDWDTALGCPKHIDKVPDVPTLPEPDCKFESIYGNTSRLGISVDMTQLNNGPVGIRSLFGYLDKIRLMYYTPCGYSDCPYSAKKCTDGVTSASYRRGLSSMWICDIEGEGDNQVINECVSYGDEKEQPSYVIGADEFDGLTHTLLKGDKRKAVVHYDCEQAYPDTYVEVPAIARKYDDKEFLIDVDNEDVCLRNIPYPEPSGDLCKYTRTMGNYKINIDLKTLNKEGSGYKRTVTLQTIPKQKKTIRFQPCGALICPQTSQGTSYNCDGDEDATVWICDEEGAGLGAEYSCDQYGRFYNDSKLFSNIDAIDRSYMNGMQFTYKGGLHKTAIFNLKCDQSLMTGNIELEENVKVTGNTIEFSGRNKDVCASGSGPTPTPFPIVQPVIPDPIPMPTPNPRPDNDLFVENGTHFVYIDLEAVQKNVYRGEQMLLVNGKQGSLYTEFSPWKKIPCPVGYECPTGKEANVWSCWQLQDIKKTMRCHNSGDINFGVWINTLKGKTQLNDGVMLSYEGMYSSGADIRLKCRVGKNVSDLTKLEGFSVFTAGGPSGDTFEYSTVTELSCASEFNEPYVPIPTKTPSPPINYNPSLQWESPVIDGKQIKMDLTKLATKMTDPVYIGVGDDFEKVSIYYSPSQRVSCPTGFDCVPSDSVLGNVFKCYNNGQNPECFVMGDRSYELNFALNNESNFDDGVRVEYGGGYGGKIETFFEFWCNESVDGYEFHKVAHSYASRKVRIEVESKMACPVSIQAATQNTTGGAVFLLIVFCGTTLYVVLGVVFVFFTTGAVALPNSGFWTEFFECVATGAIFIGTCGKTTSVTKANYDTI
jgi:hypothetical protein